MMVDRESDLGWIDASVRQPDLPDLKVTFEKGSYQHYGGCFLVWDEHSIFIDTFEKPPKNQKKDGKTVFYSGYWRSEGSLFGNTGRKVRAWMPLPAPPVWPYVEEKP